MVTSLFGAGTSGALPVCLLFAQFRQSYELAVLLEGMKKAPCTSLVRHYSPWSISGAGGFGAPASSPGFGATPSAFGTPASSSAFGGFGQSAGGFGFGTTSTPASSSAFGFGGFGASTGELPSHSALAFHNNVMKPKCWFPAAYMLSQLLQW